MTRREFVNWSGKALLGLSLLKSDVGISQAIPMDTLKLFLAGDLMSGRGIDQILPHSVDPELHEPFVRDARDYVELAEIQNGEIDRPVSYEYPWGDALEVLQEAAPDARIVNLETSITTSDDWARNKQIHYRMHPKNVDLLGVAGLDVCSLGNNHVRDWGERGLHETLDVLAGAGIEGPGAGRDQDSACEPTVLQTRAARLLVFSYGTPSAGVPPRWQATENDSGVNLLPDLGSEVQRVIERIEKYRRPGDLVILSLHWGDNWGYRVPPEQREFAHRLIDAGSIDVLHGHSSHHPKAVEVYRGKPVLYGAGDLLNDYEGISGREEFRSELVLLYFPELDSGGTLVSFEMMPMRIRKMQLRQASEEERRWLAGVMDRECRQFGSRVELTGTGLLALRWAGS